MITFTLLERNCRCRIDLQPYCSGNSIKERATEFLVNDMKRKTKLKIQVWLLHWLQKIRIMPNVWFACEIELAKKEAKDIARYLKWDSYSQEI